MTICLAVDIGGTKIAAALIEMYSAAKSNIVARHLIETRSSGDPLLLTAALAELLGPLAASADYVAVASTGIIDNGVLTALNPQNLGGLDHFPLHNVIAQITDLPVYLINDAQGAAWAEYLAYRQEFADLAFITVSTGVGAGLILNHKLITGSRGLLAMLVICWWILKAHNVVVVVVVALKLLPPVVRLRLPDKPYSVVHVVVCRYISFIYKVMHEHRLLFGVLLTQSLS